MDGQGDRGDEWLRESAEHSGTGGVSHGVLLVGDGVGGSDLRPSLYMSNTIDKHKKRNQAGSRLTRQTNSEREL